VSLVHRSDSEDREIGAKPLQGNPTQAER
jgi:hypothetical protein